MVELKLPIPEDFLKEEVRCGYTVSKEMKEVWAVQLDLFAETWNQFAKENGLEGFYFFALAQGTRNLNRFDRSCYDAVVFDRLIDLFREYETTWFKRKLKSLHFRLHRPLRLDYNTYIDKSLESFRMDDALVPCINPDFDHIPRSSYRWIVFDNSTPDKWERLCHQSVGIIKNRTNNNELLFIKSWNEWGEGNYLEPDQKWGRAYLDATSRALSF